VQLELFAEDNIIEHAGTSVVECTRLNHQRNPKPPTPRITHQPSKTYRAVPNYGIYRSDHTTWLTKLLKVWKILSSNRTLQGLPSVWCELTLRSSHGASGRWTTLNISFKSWFARFFPSVDHFGRATVLYSGLTKTASLLSALLTSSTVMLCSTPFDVLIYFVHSSALIH
jgi:hypothetical protein